MRDEQRERIAKLLLQAVREIWGDRGTNEPPYFNCSVCEFEDDGGCRLKQFIETPMYEMTYSKGMIKGGDTE